MKIVSWNLNSIRARIDRLLAWLDANQPDVLCAQETKVVDELFPHEALASVGYRAAVHGQKTYNGVALISREEITDVVCGFGDGVDDPQARFLGGTLRGVRVFSAYVPNGSSLESEKYQYKLEWLARLRAYLNTNEKAGTPVALCGDWNVAPDDRDIHDPRVWEGGILCSDKERAALKHIVDWGFTDTFRMHCEEAGKFSWWDYRMLGFPKNKGLRIDHIYATEKLRARCIESNIDRDERKGKGASDHAPVVSVFDCLEI
ncbi:MAG: exodeoxyribonuclease III [Myxococcales bacterium]|nr:exodeoxyribonuclease III [Myxococcales bacterium]